MALIELNFKPGIDKQDTEAGAENRWVDSDNVRFRYGLPEKVGGWASLTTDTIVGVVRKQHAFVDNDGNRYVALGTDKFLLLYFEGQLYDITPVKTTLTSATIATTNGSPTCTITKAAHGVKVGDIVQLNSVTLPGGTGFNNADFEDKNFQVISVPTTGTFTINQSSNASGTVSTGGSLSVIPYEPVGPREQTYGYGWGMDPYGNGNWGEAAAASDVTLEPGLWSLSNFGEVLIATVLNGKTFTWNSGIGARLTTRASTTTSNFETTNNPTKTRVTLVSPTTRHLIHLGTETTIGTATSQNKMFIRFSDQESTSVYAPTSTNTAGTFQLDDGTRIVGAFKGKDYILVLTDTAAYEMQFVGPPFTFSIRKVGSNNGLMGQHAGVFANGAVFWMGKTGGFYVYDGTVKSLPCLVEDFVFTTDGNNPGINYDSGQIVFAGINELYSEINWFYPTSGSNIVNRVVTYNYDENVWTTGTLDRTTWIGSTVYEVPYATDYNASDAPTFPTVSGVSNGATIYYAHEVGLNQANGDGSQTAITSFIKSGEFDLNGRQGVPGDGEFLMSIKRFLPDFKRISGNAKVTIFLNQFPQGTTASSSPLGPFTVSSSTSKIDTRARARLASVQIENENLDESWRYGPFRFDVRVDGRR